MNYLAQLLCVMVSLTGGIHCVSLLRDGRKPAGSPAGPVTLPSKSALRKSVCERVNRYCQVLLATAFLAVAASLLVALAYRGLSPLWEEDPLDRQVRRSIATVSIPEYPPVVVKYDTIQPGNPVNGIECHSKLISDDQVRRLLRTVPTLRVLNLAHTDVSDSALSDLRCVSALCALTLCGTRVGDVGVRHVAKVKNLEDLYLDGTHVTDNGLRFLANVRSLRRLSLRSTAVTDAGLEWLGALDKLEVLDLRNTRVTDETMNRLKKKHPCVEIISRLDEGPR